MVLALVQAVIALAVAFGLNLAPDQIGAILAVTAVILGLVSCSRVSPVQRMTRQRSPHPSRRATDREVGVVAADLVAGVRLRRRP